MDGQQFDDLTRSLLFKPSRRRVASVLAGGIVGLLAQGGQEAVAKPCPPCRKKRKGRCKKKRPDGTPCGANKACQGGVCACRPDTVLCGADCVDTETDARNCGACGKRCQLNAVCTDGFCFCVDGPCSSAGSSCCPAGPSDICVCLTQASGQFIDPTTCLAVDSCPAERQCVGPECQACCPVGAGCDAATGTCLK